jgi:hypothetical protein
MQCVLDAKATGAWCAQPFVVAYRLTIKVLHRRIVHASKKERPSEGFEEFKRNQEVVFEKIGNEVDSSSLGGEEVEFAWRVC